MSSRLKRGDSLIYLEYILRGFRKRYFDTLDSTIKTLIFLFLCEKILKNNNLYCVNHSSKYKLCFCVLFFERTIVSLFIFVDEGKSILFFRLKDTLLLWMSKVNNRCFFYKFIESFTFDVMKNLFFCV